MQHRLIDLLTEEERKEFESDRRFGYLGFTIYDIIHIVFSLGFLLYAILGRPAHWDFTLVECIAELVFAVLLIGFVDMMVEHHEVEGFRRYYIFAWLTAAAATFLPLCFELPAIIEHGFHEKSHLFFLLAIILSGLSFVSFFLTLWRSDSGKHWELLRFISVTLVALSVPMSIAAIWLDEGLPLLVQIAKTVLMCAPLVPASFAYYDIIEDAIRLGKQKGK